MPQALREIRDRGIKSVAVPPLGSTIERSCGLGGLDWRDVQPRITRAFAELPSVRMLLFQPAADRPVEGQDRERKAALDRIAREAFDSGLCDRTGIPEGSEDK